MVIDEHTVAGPNGPAFHEEASSSAAVGGRKRAC
jgi:hypothetical protein